MDLRPSTPQFPNAVHYGTALSALVGVALWALQTYAYPHVPGAIQAEIPILVPVVLGYVVSMFVRKNTKPVLPKPSSAGQVTVTPPPQTATTNSAKT